LPGASLRPGSLAFNPRPRRLSTPSDAFRLHPDNRSYGTTRSGGGGETRGRGTRGRGDGGGKARAQGGYRGGGELAWSRVEDAYEDEGDDRGDDANAAGDEVRSIHWFPYDRVGVVNADP
jgi:hypothetical protein